MTEKELADWLLPRGWILGIQESMFGSGTIYRVIHVDHKSNLVRHVTDNVPLWLHHQMIKAEIMKWEEQKAVKRVPSRMTEEERTEMYLERIYKGLNLP